MEKDNKTDIFPKGEKITNGYFTGDAYLNILVPRDKNNNFTLGNVSFEAGARTNWHTHPKGQVLLILDGQGWYQEKNKAAQSIKKGDVINIPENVEHWHGASADQSMIHVAISNYQGDENVIWFSPVTEEEYNSVHN